MQNNTKNNIFKQGRIHGSISCVRVGRGSMPCSWVGAVTQICFPFRFKRPKTRSDYGPTDRRTNRPMDQPTNIVTYRVACTRLKTNCFSKINVLITSKQMARGYLTYLTPGSKYLIDLFRLSSLFVDIININILKIIDNFVKIHSTAVLTAGLEVTTQFLRHTLGFKRYLAVGNDASSFFTVFPIKK